MMVSMALLVLALLGCQAGVTGFDYMCVHVHRALAGRDFSPSDRQAKGGRGSTPAYVPFQV